MFGSPGQLDRKVTAVSWCWIPTSSSVSFTCIDTWRVRCSRLSNGERQRRPSGLSPLPFDPPQQIWSLTVPDCPFNPKESLSHSTLSIQVVLIWVISISRLKKKGREGRSKEQHEEKEKYQSFLETLMRIFCRDEINHLSSDTCLRAIKCELPQRRPSESQSSQFLCQAHSF